MEVTKYAICLVVVVVVVVIVVVVVVVVVVVILFPTEYKQWRTEQMSNITTTINIDDPVGGHQRSQRLNGLATKWKLYF